jgi:hypothetical protein
MNVNGNVTVTSFTSLFPANVMISDAYLKYTPGLISDVRGLGSFATLLNSDGVVYPTADGISQYTLPNVITNPIPKGKVIYVMGSSSRMFTMTIGSSDILILADGRRMNSALNDIDTLIPISQPNRTYGMYVYDGFNTWLEVDYR